MTSSEMYDGYIRVREIEDKLRRANKGLNLINSEKFKPPTLFINVLREYRINVLEREDYFCVPNNLNVGGCSYYGDDTALKEFLKDLKSWAITPIYKFFIKHNRRQDNLPSSWGMPDFRTRNIKFEDINIVIGKRAQQELDRLGIDFKGEVKRLLALQRTPTAEEIKDFERYWLLLNIIEDLGRQLNKQSNYGYYESDKDKTIPISIGKYEYNDRLKAVEKELKGLIKKYSFLESKRFDYAEILKKPTLKGYMDDNKYELEREWGNLDEDEQGEYKNYADFIDQQYNGYIDAHDFDE